MREAATRSVLVDAALASSGWAVVRFAPAATFDRAAVAEHPTASGPADYVLYLDGRPVAVVEAKQESEPIYGVLTQAQRYARDLDGPPANLKGYRVPFLYSTNGREIWFQDVRPMGSRARPLMRFHTPGALRELLGRDDAMALAALAGLPNELPYLRPYQKEAIGAIEAALRAGKRRMLVAMATGTGKTVTIVSLLYRLLEAKAFRRILFLVDRRELGNQAVNTCAAFEPRPGLKFDRIYEVYGEKFAGDDEDAARYNPRELPQAYLTSPQAHHGYVYVCTVQRMRSILFGWEDQPPLDVPIHAFDCVVADEVHRGYTSAEDSKWREVLSHFDAVQIGLTATPAKHTVAYFGEVVYRYPYRQAVADGYLVDYDVVRITSGITMEGLFLRPGEHVKMLDRQTRLIEDDVLEDEREYDTSQLERDVTVPDRNRKIVAEFARHGREDQKSLVFAVNDEHADALVQLLREQYSHLGDEFVQKITYKVDRPLDRIREFRNRPKPGIAVTVDMLSTGVDIPRIENLLFVRPVRSRILFEQMVGRGTRRCDEIKKDHFTIFDACGLLGYFRGASEFGEPRPAAAAPLREILYRIERNEDRDEHVALLVRRLRRVARSASAQAVELFKAYVPNGDIGAFAADLSARLAKDFETDFAPFRDPAFLDLLENYPREPRTLVIAEEVVDWATSEPLFHTADGRDLKLDDYIASFEAYVREHPTEIEALHLLLTKPQAFKWKDLKELRAKLAARPERFTEERLRRAYRFSLADIIAFVRHAARGEPLMSPEERVARVWAQLVEGKEWTPAQKDWLGLIRSHLVVNLSIERDDFADLPFSRRGGWKGAKRAFGDQLESLLEVINDAIAA